MILTEALLITRAKQPKLRIPFIARVAILIVYTERTWQEVVYVHDKDKQIYCYQKEINYFSPEMSRNLLLISSSRVHGFGYLENAAEILRNFLKK